MNPVKYIEIRTFLIAIIGACLCMLVLITSTAANFSTLENIRLLEKEFSGTEGSDESKLTDNLSDTTTAQNISRATNYVKSKIVSGLIIIEDQAPHHGNAGPADKIQFSGSNY